MIATDTGKCFVFCFVFLTSQAGPMGVGLV